MNYSLQKRVVIFSFLFIPISLLLLFLVYPSIKLMQLSFTDWNGISRQLHYVGFKNYFHLFSLPEVWRTLYNNWLYLFFMTVSLPLEIMLAVALNARIRASSFFRSVVFLPHIINGVAVAYIFSYFYSPINGSLNELLHMAGLDAWIRNWLSDKDVVNYSLVAVSLWKHSGFQTILFLAGMQSIPNDLYEAARLDGAGFWQQLRHITIPGLRRVIEINLFLNVKNSLQVFEIPFLITQGGPGTISSTFTVYTIDTAFRYNSYGLASAMAITLMAMIIILSSMQTRLIKEKGGDKR